MSQRFSYRSRTALEEMQKEREAVKQKQSQRLLSRFLHPAFHLLFQKSDFILNDSEWIKLNSEYVESASKKVFTQYYFQHKYHSHRPETLKLYHGTNISRAALILARQGLTLSSKRNIETNKYGNGSMFGEAVYVGPREKALNYTGARYFYGQNAKPVFGVIFEVEVNPGKILEVSSIGDYSKECDTVYAPKGWGGAGSFTSLRNEEYAVYNPKRVKIIGFEIVKNVPPPSY